MKNEKLAAYVGFAIKSREVIFGFDKIKETNKKIHLIILCKTLSEKVKQKLIILAKDRGVAFIQPEEVLEIIIGRPNCKVLAICNEGLAAAIKQTEIENKG